MTQRHWFTGLASGAAIAFVVAAAMTFVDWQLNPAGIFRGPEGTNWRFVWDTWISWFLPTLPVTIAIALIIVWLKSRFG